MPNYSALLVAGTFCFDHGKYASVVVGSARHRSVDADDETKDNARRSERIGRNVEILSSGFDRGRRGIREKRDAWERREVRRRSRSIFRRVLFDDVFEPVRRPGDGNGVVDGRRSAAV